MRKFLLSFFIVLLLLILAAIGFGLGIRTAFSHGDADWVQNESLHDPVSHAWCCGEHDCFRQTAGAVWEVSGGFYVAATDEVIPFSRVLWRSPTGEFWACFEIVDGTPSKVRCLIAPPRGQ